MQFELLLDGAGQVPAKEDQRIAAMAFGVKEAPGFLWSWIQDDALISVDRTLRSIGIVAGSVAGATRLPVPRW